MKNQIEELGDIFETNYIFIFCIVNFRKINILNVKKEIFFILRHNSPVEKSALLKKLKKKNPLISHKLYPITWRKPIRKFL